MRTASPIFDPLPPGYSGPPTPPPGGKPEREDRAPPGEPEVLEDIPFDTEPPRSKIVHERPGIASKAAAEGPTDASSAGGSKIRMFEQALGSKHEDNWSRTPNVTGAGAIHVKSFHCKLTGDSLNFLDQQINEWLDAHPQYEVKMVTTSIGTWTGKLKEPNLIVNVWV
ncbi:MAG: hypothetical protein RIB60_09450 [Phycisphaerales bacterium]